jgi:hypothetical protein
VRRSGISSCQGETNYQAFPLVKVKPTDGNASTLSTKEKGVWLDNEATSLILIESSLIFPQGDTEVFSQTRHTFFDNSAFMIEQVIRHIRSVPDFHQAITIFLPAHLIMGRDSFGT